MGRPKKDAVPEAPAKDEKLEGMLKDFRDNEWQAIELVKYLEGDSYKKDKHTQVFCKSYVIALIQEYCIDVTQVNYPYNIVVGTREDKTELLLAAYGCLCGFDSLGRGARDRKYYKCAHPYNKLIAGDWKGESITASFRPLLLRLERELSNNLHDIKEKNCGKLGFIDQAPRKLALPKLRYSASGPNIKQTYVLDTSSVSKSEKVKKPFSFKSLWKSTIFPLHYIRRKKTVLNLQNTRDYSKVWRMWCIVMLTIIAICAIACAILLLAIYVTINKHYVLDVP